MKQFTTQEQWNELNDKEKRKLIDWENKDGKTGLASITDNDPDYIIFSIGDLIEFLDENNHLITVDVIPPIYSVAWRKGHELVDVLWEAVKGVLA